VKWLVRLYPARWRRRYGAEFETVLASQAPSLWQILDVLRGALDAHLHPDLGNTSQHTFERLDAPGQWVLTLAQEEARHLGHSYLGTEHVLLGLARAEAGPAPRVLRDLGVSSDAVRARIEAILGPGAPGRRGGRCRHERIGDARRLTPRTKRAFQRAGEEADRLHHARISDAHLLLGIIEEGESVGARVLREMDVGDAATLRQRVLDALNAPPAQ